MTRRIGVYNQDGQKINTILVEEDVLTDPTYWPGYGIALIDEGEELVKPPVFTPTGRPKEWIGLLDVKLEVVPQTGEIIDLATGKVILIKPDPIIDVTDALSVEALVG